MPCSRTFVTRIMLCDFTLVSYRSSNYAYVNITVLLRDLVEIHYIISISLKVKAMEVPLSFDF